MKGSLYVRKGLYKVFTTLEKIFFCLFYFTWTLMVNGIHDITSTTPFPTPRSLMLWQVYHYITLCLTQLSSQQKKEKNAIAGHPVSHQGQLPARVGPISATGIMLKHQHHHPLNGITKDPRWPQHPPPTPTTWWTRQGSTPPWTGVRWRTNRTLSWGHKVSRYHIIRASSLPVRILLFIAFQPTSTRISHR